MVTIISPTFTGISQTKHIEAHLAWLSFTCNLSNPEVVDNTNLMVTYIVLILYSISFSLDRTIKLLLHEHKYLIINIQNVHILGLQMMPVFTEGETKTQNCYTAGSTCWVTVRSWFAWYLHLNQFSFHQKQCTDRFLLHYPSNSHKAPNNHPHYCSKFPGLTQHKSKIWRLVPQFLWHIKSLMIHSVLLCFSTAQFIV